uniref:hypothetical protein n=1 Tax=Pseudovibrio sp. POLY-S9 TaxID=1576596 RepID=UPI001AD91BF7
VVLACCDPPEQSESQIEVLGNLIDSNFDRNALVEHPLSQQLNGQTSEHRTAVCQGLSSLAECLPMRSLLFRELYLMPGFP